jgi:hypothetical protein
MRACDGVHRVVRDSFPIVMAVTWNWQAQAQFDRKPVGTPASRSVMEGPVTGSRRTASALAYRSSISNSRGAHAALGKANYAPIDEHRTAASNSDIAAAWLAAGLIGLALLVALPL